MKKRFLSMSLACAMTIGLLAGCGNGATSSGGGSSASSGGDASSTGGGGASAISNSWKVTCPWAPSGVAAMVSQKAATLSPTYSDSISLVAEAIAGDAATVNTWVLDTEANDPELVFVGEGLLSITSTIDPSKMQFTEDDFVFVENLYSSIFVLSADAELPRVRTPALRLVALLARDDERFEAHGSSPRDDEVEVLIMCSHAAEADEHETRTRVSAS